MRYARFLVSASLTGWIAMSSPAFAKPVYLSCTTVENGAAPERFEVTADEDVGTVAVSGPGYNQSYRAAFSRDRVTFSDRVIFDYSINRTDLSITVTRVNGSIAKGKCQLEPPPKRAF
jgi:hypothetical protein